MEKEPFTQFYGHFDDFDGHFEYFLWTFEVAKFFMIKLYLDVGDAYTQRHILYANYGLHVNLGSFGWCHFVL